MGEVMEAILRAGRNRHWKDIDATLLLSNNDGEREKLAARRPQCHTVVETSHGYAQWWIGRDPAILEFLSTVATSSRVLAVTA